MARNISLGHLMAWTLRIRNLRKSWFPEIRISGDPKVPDVWISGFRKTGSPSSPDFWNFQLFRTTANRNTDFSDWGKSGFQDFRSSGSPDFRIAGNPEFRWPSEPFSIKVYKRLFKSHFRPPAWRTTYLGWRTILAQGAFQSWWLHAADGSSNQSLTSARQLGTLFALFGLSLEGSPIDKKQLEQLSGQPLRPGSATMICDLG